jgi:hypothetical protein
MVVLPRPATGPASDLGVACIAELVADPALPVVDEHAHDVGVLVEHVRRRRVGATWMAWMA